MAAKKKWIKYNFFVKLNLKIKLNKMIKDLHPKNNNKAKN